MKKKLLSYFEAASFFQNTKFCAKLEILKFGTKNTLFEYFLAGILKNICHIWNQRPRVCFAAKFCKIMSYRGSTKFNWSDMQWLSEILVRFGVFLTPPQYFLRHMTVRSYTSLEKTYLLLGIFFVAKWGVLTWGYSKKFRSDLELFNSSSIPHISRVLTHTFN